MKLKISKTFATYKTWEKKKNDKYTLMYISYQKHSYSRALKIALRILFSIEFEKPFKN